MLELRIGLPEGFQKEAVRLYYEAFEQKFVPLMNLEEATDVLSGLLNHQQVVCAFYNQRLVGFAGIQHNKKMLFRISLPVLIRKLGVFRGLFVGLVMALFKRPYRKNELLMDGICVDKNFRGKGIGTSLLKTIFEFAQKNNYKSIRLDVVDSNPRAQKLYENVGFQQVKRHNYPFLKKLMGFSASITMIKELSR